MQLSIQTQKPPPGYPLFLTPALQGMRFFAAIFVFLGHMGWTFAGANGSLYFLVLSGYAVTRLLIREWEQLGTIDLLRFWKRRAQKLLPPFFFAMLLTVIIKDFIGAPIQWGHVLSMILFVGNYYNAIFNHPTEGFSLYWTISLLAQFYLLWPLCFSYFIEKSKLTLMWITLSLIIGPVMLRTLLIRRGLAIFPYLYNAFESRVDALALGCLFGLLASAVFFERLRPWIARTGAEPFLTLGLLLYLGTRENSFRLSWGLSLQALLLGILIIQLVLLQAHSIWKWLSARPMTYLGSLSYCFYLFHGFGKSIGIHAPLGDTAQTGIGVLATLGLSAAFAPWFNEKAVPTNLNLAIEPVAPSVPEIRPPNANPFAPEQSLQRRFGRALPKSSAHDSTDGDPKVRLASMNAWRGRAQRKARLTKSSAASRLKLE